MAAAFVLAFLLCLACLVVPGFLVCVSLGAGWRASLCLAPGPSLFLYFLVSLVLGEVAVDGLAPLAVGVAGSAVVIAAAVWAVRSRTGGGLAVEQPPLWAVALYAAVGCALFAFLFLRNTGGLDWFLQYNDNSAHLTRIRAMVDGATTSPLRSMMYGSNVVATQTPFSPDSVGFSAPASFYPVAYHNVAALVLATGVAPIAMVQNALNAAFAAVVFPLGVCALLAQVMRGDGRAVLCGAVTCGASYAFPLRALVIHQNYPNVAAFCCLPLAVCLMMVAFTVKDPQGGDGAGAGADGEGAGGTVRVFPAAVALWLVSLLGLVDLHPNAVIACAVVGGCYLMGRIVPSWARTLPRKAASALLFVAAELGVLVVCLSLWLACLVSPVFEATVGFLWDWTLPVPSALEQVALLGLRIPVVQPVLAAAVALGLLWCATHRGRGWIALTYGVLAVVFFANAAGTPTVKRIFAGFFYTDPDRTAALVGLWASVVAAFGLYAAMRGVVAVITLVGRRWSGGAGLPKAVPWAAAGALCALFVVGNYGEALAVDSYPEDGDHIYLAPSKELPGGAFAWQQWELRWTSDPDHSMFWRRCDAEFMERVRQVVGTGDLIVNIPLDGSMYAYPVDGVNVLYKRELVGEDSEVSRILRLRLNEYATDPEVQAAVRALDARYVLQLSAKGPEGANYGDYERNRPRDWVGIASITPDTPGFELVLSEGNMALYKILPLDGTAGQGARDGALGDGALGDATAAAA